MTYGVIRLGSDGDSAVAADSAQLPTAGDSFTPELGLPATDVVAIGASPSQSPGEVWAYAKLGDTPTTVAGHSYRDQYVLLERTDGVGWQVVPLPSAAGGGPLAPTTGGPTPALYGPFAGATTDAGGIVLLSGQEVVVGDPVHDPAQPPTLTLAKTPPSTEPDPTRGLAPGESLLPTHISGPVTLPFAAIEDGDGHTGLLIAPFNDGGSDPVKTPPGVLHYDVGEGWTREPIETGEGEPLQRFVALALSCGGTAAPDSSSPRSCWLLASAQTQTGRTALLLYRRVSAGSLVAWKREQVPGLLGEAAETTLAPLPQGAQMLTATAQGVWVDFQAKVNSTSGSGGQAYSDVSELVSPGSSSASVLGPWCYPTGPRCEQRTLGGQLPTQYRSFASPGAGAGDPGSRVITGLVDRAMLELAGGNFFYVAGPGGDIGTAAGGAALYPSHEGSLWEGWIADGANAAQAIDGEGQSQVVAVRPAGDQNEQEAVPFIADPRFAGDQLGQEAVPFRRPLYALAQAPDTLAGDPTAQAVAVGEDGEIGRYTPGLGWRPESLLDGAGRVQRPTLRGVAWPESGRAYAVGDNGAMWVWRADTGMWEPDPAKPYNFVANLTGIAFSAVNPDIGYAVGKQGTMLKAGKTWEQVPLPPELQRANFTSIAFAGQEALATYRLIEPVPGSHDEFLETGGLAVEEDGSGEHWHVDAGASALLAGLPPEGTVLSRVAGLADGGAVAAGPSAVIERDSPSSSWHFSAQPLPEAQNISALAAYRDTTGAVRAVVSIDLNEDLGPNLFSGVALEQGPYKVDLPAPPAAGQPPTQLEPDPPPDSGYLLMETSNGWTDLEHDAWPAPPGPRPVDMPARPDPVLAVLVSPSGNEGLTVGGQTGDLEGGGVSPELHPNNSNYQTAAAERFPASIASTNGSASPAPVSAPGNSASFVIAGNASCAREGCAELASESLGPDTWLTHALQRAGEIATASPAGALRGFVYTGGRLPTRGSGESFQRELSRYAALLDDSSVPVLPADSSDLGPFVPGSATPYYTYLSNSTAGGGQVLVIVLDCSSGEVGSAQRAWLAERLHEAAVARTPAIVVGNAALGFQLPDASEAPAQLADATAVARVLVEGGASAYFFDYPGVNVRTTVNWNGQSIPAYGTGTLGYVSPPNERFTGDSLGSSGFLLATVKTGERVMVKTPKGQIATNIAPVTAEVIPNIGQLALDATDGVLLRRSHVALFQALARRPLAGVSIKLGASGNELAGPDPYDSIPSDCLGPNCAYEVPTRFTFTSSNPEIGNFVAHDPTSANPRQVLLGSNLLPVPDSHSRLFCAFNAGTTTVSITTGGLTYSEPVTVQAGSAEYPCGTVSLHNTPQAEQQESLRVPPFTPKAPAEKPSLVPIIAVPPLPPLVPVRKAVKPKPKKIAATVYPFIPVPALALLRPAILPPPPPAGRPSPPQTTSSAQVYQSAYAPEREDEEEQAIDLVHNYASYRSLDDRALLYVAPLVILLLAYGGSVLRGGLRRRNHSEIRQTSGLR